MNADELRARFDESTTRHFADPLPGGIVVRPSDPTKWSELFKEVSREAFTRGDGVDFGRVFSAEESQRQADLGALVGSSPLEHRLVFLEGDKVVGCYWGAQETWGRYYMIATMIRPLHQGRGVYSAFLSRLIEVLRETGFKEIYSRHHPDNNAILIPKLKAGFILCSFEITPNFGLLVHLRYPLNEKLRAVYAYRIEASQGSAALETFGILKQRAGI